MVEALHLVCPHCEAVNRAPASRLEQAAKCGRCHRPLFDGHVTPLTEAEPTLAAEFSIRSIPTLALFKGGRELARQSGALRKADIIHWVNSVG